MLRLMMLAVGFSGIGLYLAFGAVGMAGLVWVLRQA